ncbi:hypothetical protein J3R83DRAFT_9222, partial [Lanmaoa asiatica]
MRHGYFEGTIISQMSEWTLLIFLSAADCELLHPLIPFLQLISITVVMILRVYAMWHRSKRVLWILLFIYVPLVIISFVFQGIYNTPTTYISVQIHEGLDLSFCDYSWSNTNTKLLVYSIMVRFVLSAALLVLAIVRTLKQSFEMYKATKQWQSNRYMQLLMRDEIIYFMLYVLLFRFLPFPFVTTMVSHSNALFNITTMLQTYVTPSNTSIVFMDLLWATILPMTPRFIISVRELYDRDLRSHSQGIDTGFGVLSQTVSGQDAGRSAIAFADVALRQDQIVEGDTDELWQIRLDLSEDNDCQ